MPTVAIIGCGKNRLGKEGWASGHDHANGFRQADPIIELIGVDTNPVHLAEFGEKFDLPSKALFESAEELYRSVLPDYVVVSTWPESHSKLCIQASNLGVKGIICEKPVALNLPEIRDLVAVCKRNGTPLAIAHQRRHNYNFALAKDLIDKGEIGGRLVLEARVADNWDILTWGIHWFDIANYLFSACPLWVLAGISFADQRRYNHAVEDSSVVFAQYPGENQAIFITGPENFLETSFFIRGSKGFMSFSETGALQIVSPAGMNKFETKDHVDCFKVLATELIFAAEKGLPMKCRASECVMATEMGLACHESARLHSKIQLPPSFEHFPLKVLSSSG